MLDLTPISQYYGNKVIAHGPTPLGVDWNGEVSQTSRFDQLVKIIGHADEFSINDLGCGYAPLYGYLNRIFPAFSYVGVDISAEMIQTAECLCQYNPNCTFKLGTTLTTDADYSIASGLFNVKLNIPNEDWLRHIRHCLDNMHERSICGFATNFLTKHSHPERKKNYLYYADPSEVLEYCLNRFSKKVTLIHGYDLYDFTVLIYK